MKFILEIIWEVVKKLCEVLSKVDFKSLWKKIKGFFIYVANLLRRVKQIKILAITASPEDGQDIRYEKEQDILLKTFKGSDRHEIYLDIPDPVKSTTTEIREHLEEGRHDILYISAHGSIDEEGQGFLCLEGPQGEEQKVTGAELADILMKLKKNKGRPYIVILSSCYSARRGLNLTPAAQALFEAGITAVIGMEKVISDLAAIDFSLGFFTALKEKHTVKKAFEAGQQAVQEGEAKRLKEIPGWKYREEDKVPSLLTRKNKLNRKNFSRYRITAPERLASYEFLDAKNIDSGFIGRRKILREIYQKMAGGAGAVVLKGPGGIGKSITTTRAAANLRRQGYDFIVIRGEITVEEILMKIRRKAAGRMEKAEDVLNEDTDVNEKLKEFLDHFLLKQKIVVIFENFEENQDEEKDGDFIRKPLKDFLGYFRGALEDNDSILFFSTRYRIPGFEDLEIELGEFTEVEFRKMLLNSRALQRLDGKSAEKLLNRIGGNPRALKLLDDITRREFGKQEFSWEQLDELIKETEVRVSQEADKGDYFKPLFLDRLTGKLTKEQQQVLGVLSIFRSPVKKEALKPHDVSLSRADRRRLEDFSLLEYKRESKTFYVHRLTAQHLLERMKPKKRDNLHILAAKYFDGIRTKEEVSYLEDLIEARWHFLRAGEWNRAAELTFDLNKYLSLHGFRPRAMELLQELDLKRLNKKNKAGVNHQVGILKDYFGEHDSALTYYEEARKIRKSTGDSQGKASTLHQIGNNYYLRGEPAEARKWYNQSLKIRERIGDEAGIAGTRHQIGMLYHDEGKLDEALKEYEQSLKIREDIGDERDIAESLYQIGMVHQEKGNKEDALNKYTRALEFFEKNADIVNAAITMGQLGQLYLELKKYKEALENLCRAFPLLSALQLPYVNHAVKGIALAREKLPKEKYTKILIKFQLQPQEFDDRIKALEAKEYPAFLYAITIKALDPRVRDNKEMVASLNQLIDKTRANARNDRESKGLKCYFQLLLASVKGEDVQKYLKSKKIPGDLKEIYNTIKSEMGS